MNTALAPIQIPPVAPIEILVLSIDLDGQFGTNRAVGKTSQIRAQNDIDAIRAWLLSYMDNKRTFDNYRREAERLLLWSVTQLRKPLSSLSHEDLVQYRFFLANPQPTEQWVMTGRKWGRQDPRWRPFAGPLDPNTSRLALVILNTMFGWLVEAGYLAGNPLSLSRKRSKKKKPRVTRFLQSDTWQDLKDSIRSMSRETPREIEHAVRVRWLFSLLYICNLRISEVCNNSMGSFFRRLDSQGNERWWLEIVGKGEKTRLVPATSELMAELMGYRSHFGLPPYPAQGETTPLLLPIGGKPRPMTRSGVHTVVKEVFAQAVRRLEKMGPETAPRITELERASAHWMRHTGGTNMASAGMDLRNLRDNFGHDSIDTTNIYLHTEDDKRHQETEDLHKLRW